MSREAFLIRSNGVAGNTTSHKRAKKQEKALALRVGGRLTPASGAKSEKGDVRVRKVMRIEAKTTKNKSFSVTLDMIRKIEEAALSADEMPVLVIEFINEQGQPISEVAVVPSYVLDSIRENK